MWGGGEGQLSSLSAQELSTDTFESVQHHYTQEIISLSTILCVTRRTFLALNDSCPRAHFHTGNNESRITFNDITVLVLISTSSLPSTCRRLKVQQLPKFFICIIVSKPMHTFTRERQDGVV